MDTPEFPGFDILETMPHGGMSTVYKARQISLDRIVALKTLPLIKASEPADLNQFLAEARITANLKHPNIVQVYDFGQTDAGLYYFVMEFISGYSVGEWIRRKHGISEQNSLLLAVSVAEALNYAWKNAGVVHCDIKPDNIIIDGDGTVKVADLGLAKSVRSAVSGAPSSQGLVFGTPNYISPEQSRGDAALDCRADIYSLGATLYHAMSGQMPFEGVPAQTAMDLQITDQIPDIQDLNNRISVEAATLLEKMLAKDRNQRPADWEAFQLDLNRVMQHQMPAGELLPANASTMRRSANRSARPRVKSSTTLALPVVPGAGPPDNTAFRNMQRQFALKHKPQPGIRPEWWFAGLIALAMLVLGLLVARNVLRHKPVSSGPGALPPVVPVVNPVVGTTSPPPEVNPPPGDAAAREMFEYAQKWARDNPKQINEAIQKYRQVALQHRDTKYAFMARAEINKCQEALQNFKAEVMRNLESQAAPLIASNEFGKAAALYEQYQGDWAAETAVSRASQARDLHEREREFRERQQKIAEETERQWRQLLERVAGSLLDGDPSAGLASIRQAAEKPEFAGRKNDLEGLNGTLAEVSRMDQGILNSYRAFKGQEITVNLVSGAEKLLIEDVKDDTVQALQSIKVGVGSFKPRPFRLADLTVAEKRARLPAAAAAETALMQGLLSVRERDWATAESWFAKATPLLSAALLAGLEPKKIAQMDERARRELLALLKNAQIEAPRENAGCEEFLAAIARKGITPREAEQLAKAVERFNADFGQTQFARQFEPVLKALVQAATGTPPEHPPFKPPVKPPQPPEVKQPPPPDQVPLFVKNRLLERNKNLEFSAIDLQADDLDRITRIRIGSPQLKDIRPLAGLADVRSISFAGASSLMELQPLRTMPKLQELDLSHMSLRDLTALKGLALTRLTLVNMRITDVSSLGGMPLTELNLDNTTLVRDISSLRNAPLQRLSLNNTKVSDLMPLKGNSTLQHLSISRTEVRDLSPLNEVRLFSLDIGDTKIGNLAVLAGMPLKSLHMPRTPVADFGFLAKLKLDRLNLAQTDFSQLTLLKDMFLRDLDLSGTKIKESELVLLQKMPLETLNLSHTSFRNLAVLKEFNSLKNLNIMGTQVDNYAPLQDMNIESIWVDDKGGEQLWAMFERIPSIKRVNGRGRGFERPFHPPRR
jgi:serine/threonine-protein kinase